MNVPRLTLPAALICCAIATSTVPAQTSVRILPLGDSITEARSPNVSYRYWLWHGLRDAGFCVDFVGSMKGVYRGKPRLTDYDQDHEGHWGWRADAIARRIAGWAATSKPDIVLMHLGTNDIWQSQSVASTITDLGKIIDTLRGANRNIAIYVGRLIPGRQFDIRALNAALPALVRAKNTNASPVRLVDQFTGFDHRTMTYDGVHPNERGEKRMADIWLRALLTRLRSCRAGSTRFGTGCVGSAGTPTLTGVGLPRVGNPRFALRLDTARANTAVAMLLFSRPLEARLGSACTLWTDPRSAGVVLGSGTDAQGQAHLAIPVPNQAKLVGSALYAQGLVADPNGAWGRVFAVTAGLAIHVNR